MKYPIKNLLGIDCHQWDLASHPQQSGKDARTKALQDAIISTGFTGLRIYSDASVIKDASNTVFMFNPDGRGYEQDTAIQQLKARYPNLKVDYCYQNAPKPIQAEWAGKKNTSYRHPNTDPAKLETWADLAKDMAVIAGRGGSNTNAPDYPLFVSPNWWDTKQQMLKGAKIYDIIEPQNELDNNWSNDQFLNGSQYAVLWKAVYDAVKKIDPNIVMSTTGVMTENPQILIDALAYAKAQGWGKIFDKYQFHCYPWGWSKSIASALPPEMNMIPAAKKMVAAAGDIPCVIGEWGFDLHPDSDMGVRPFGCYAGEQIRSWWIMRSLLGFAAAGIESAFYYREFQDYGLVNDTNSTIFETSSLFIKDDQDVITRRLSGDAFYTFASKYGDFVFDSVVVEDASKVVYKFMSLTQTMYVGWTIEQVKLITVPNGAYTTNRAEFTEVKVNYMLPNGQTVSLSSNPVFVVVDGATPPSPPIPPTPPPTKEIYHRGYWTINNKRVYYVNYTDGTWTLTNGKYVPL
jgi:hypothetical protein